MVTNLPCSISRKQVALMCLCYRWVDDETPPVDRFADSASSRDEPDTPKHPMRMECWRFPAEVYTHPLEHPKDQISDRRLTRLKATKHSKFRVVRWIGDHDVVTSSPSSTSASAVETRGRSTDASLTAWYVQHAASRPRRCVGRIPRGWVFVPRYTSEYESKTVQALLQHLPLSPPAQFWFVEFVRLVVRHPNKRVTYRRSAPQ